MLKGKTVGGFFAVVALLVMALSAEGVNAAASDGIGYTHRTLGFSVTLPSGWAERYRVDENPNSAWFVSLHNEKAGFGGLLFGIEVFDEKPELPTQYAELLQVGGKYFYAIYPGGIEWAYENAALTKEYHDMFNDIEAILITFRYTAK